MEFLRHNTMAAEMKKGVRHTLRLKLMVVAVLVGIWFLVFGIFGDDLIRMFFKGDAQGNDAALTFEYAREYLHIMMGCLIPFALTQTYSGTRVRPEKRLSR